MRHVTVRQLQIFVQAAQAPTLARAAEDLHVTPAAVSFQLKQIESMSGFALFERAGRKTRLTEAGTELLAYAKIVLQTLQDADQALGRLRGVSGGRMTLGLVSTAKYFVPHVLARFSEVYPGITIHLRDGNRSEILEGVVKGELDLAIMGRPPDGSDVAAEVFAPHPSVVIAAPTHPLMAYDKLPLSILASEPFILREDGSGTRGLVEQYLSSAGLSLRVGMTTSSNEMIKQSVMAGMGIAVISRHTIGLELGLGLLRTLPVEGFPLMRSWYVAHRRSMPLMPVHARLRAFLLENGQKIIDLLERGYAARGPLASMEEDFSDP